MAVDKFVTKDYLLDQFEGYDREIASNKYASINDVPDLNNYIQKSQTNGFVMNNGSINVNTYAPLEDVVEALSGKQNVLIEGTGITIEDNVISATGGGGGASDLDDLTDVNITSLSNGQILKYNSTTEKWVNSNIDSAPTQNGTNPVSSGGVYTELEGKADLVTLATAFSTSAAYTTGQYVTYDGRLYRFRRDHNFAAWNSSDVYQVTAGHDLETKQNRTSFNQNDFTVMGESVQGSDYETYRVSLNKSDTPTQNDTKPITSGAVYGAIDNLIDGSSLSNFSDIETALNNKISSSALKSETLSSLVAADKGSTTDREYAVGLDANGKLSVNVPWTSSSGGSTVIPNPQGTASTDLTTIGIDGTNYNIPTSDTTNCYKTNDTAETTLADDDKMPFYDISASSKRSSTWSNIKAKLKSYFDGIYLSSMPIADTNTLGGIKVGNGLSIDNNGVLSANGSSGGGGINYSTSEQNTGIKWIDGNDLYQITVQASVNNETSTQIADLSSLTPSYMFIKEAYIVVNAGGTMVVPNNYVFSHNNTTFRCYISSYKLNAYSDFTGTVVVTVQYTKDSSANKYIITQMDNPNSITVERYHDSTLLSTETITSDTTLDNNIRLYQKGAYSPGTVCWYLVAQKSLTCNNTSYSAGQYCGNTTIYTNTVIMASS